MIGQGQVHASGWDSDDAVGNSPGVHRELAESIGSLLGWRKGVHQKKTETRRKIVGAYASGQGLDDAVKACRAFARTSPKVSRRSLGKRREIVGGRPWDSPLEKPEVADLRE
ncbi:hypothetical protein GW17_00022964 [Ensete ventricosum]|nr:hypothetical protein GW17_00022964 [Ensete ventricosum]